MSTLNQSIKELYQDTLSDGEVELAKDNLLGFFKLLQEIDARLQTEAQKPQNTPSKRHTEHITKQRTTNKQSKIKK